MILAMVVQPSLGQRASIMRWSLKKSSGAGEGPRNLAGNGPGREILSPARSTCRTFPRPAGSSRSIALESLTGPNASGGIARPPTSRTSSPSAACQTTGAFWVPESSFSNANVSLR